MVKRLFACTLSIAVASCLAPAMAPTPAHALVATDFADEAGNGTEGGDTPPAQPDAGGKLSNVKPVLGKTYLLLYPGMQEKLTLNTEGAAWSTNSPLVASVAQDGTVTGGEVGRCTITVKTAAGQATCLVECTYKKAYQAVQNAYVDMNTKIRYSLGLRMKKYYRDCSSFVSRLYYDKKLGRKLFTIGPKYARTWSLDAASQASWLAKKGKTVGYGKLSISKLLPGDTVYTSRGGGGIDHASFYLGNGMLMDGTGEHGKGSVGTHVYKSYTKNHRVHYIGRPCAALTLNKHTATLTLGSASSTVKLTAKYAAGKVKWKSADKSIATVSKGKVTGVAAGVTTVTATSKGKSYSCRIVVR